MNKVYEHYDHRYGGELLMNVIAYDITERSTYLSNVSKNGICKRLLLPMVFTSVYLITYSASSGGSRGCSSISFTAVSRDLPAYTRYLPRYGTRYFTLLVEVSIGASKYLKYLSARTTSFRT